MEKYWTRPPIPNMQPNKSLKSFRAGFLLGPPIQNRNMRSHSSAINLSSSVNNWGVTLKNPRPRQDPVSQVPALLPLESLGPFSKAPMVQALRSLILAASLQSQPRPINGYWIICQAPWLSEPSPSGSRIFPSPMPNAQS